MSHLGMTWGRRMLASSWRDVWGDTIHPVSSDDESSGEVTKAIVLLTDGLNGASLDLAGELPGELTVGFDSDENTLEFGCNPCSSTPRCLTLEGESYRSPRPMPEPRKPTIATGGKTTK